MSWHEHFHGSHSVHDTPADKGPNVLQERQRTDRIHAHRNCVGAPLLLLGLQPKVGATRHRKIGPCEDVSFKTARAEAERLRGLVASGHDPAGDEKAARKAKRSAHVVSLRECVNYFLEANRRRLDKKTVWAHEQTRDALPRAFMDSPAEDATAATYREAVREATHAPIMQNRHLGRLKAARLRRPRSAQRSKPRPPATDVARRSANEGDARSRTEQAEPGPG
jgi:hypothetical protein